MKNTDQFKYTFWFLVGTVSLGFLFIFMSVFHPIPKENQQNANLVLGFIIGTLVTTALNYFTGTTVGSQRKDNTIADLSKPTTNNDN